MASADLARVSKGELKKRLKKRAAKAKEAEHKAAKAKAAPVDRPVTEKKDTLAAEDAPIDPDVMFKSGFLEEVFKIRPMKPVQTRFPPEPNVSAHPTPSLPWGPLNKYLQGFLHIGHAKAIAVNFGFAKYHGGECILRFDDTNPEAEEQQYIDSIIDIIEWLGFKPSKVTYSSDNFQRLYDHAEQLILKGLAYVCRCSDADIKIQRGERGEGQRFRCHHAEQSKDENMTEFRKMRDGEYKPQEAFLRMKQNIESGNPQMWDLAAYRVLNASHHRTGTKWKIYPTYDMTHGLCDSYEGIVGLPPENVLQINEDVDGVSLLNVF
jgi:glutaminyl-tRNA synthetase